MEISPETKRVRAVCRTCMISCGVFMDIENGRVTNLIGDSSDPASHGYSCRRGRDIAGHLYGPNRILRPLAKDASGEFQSVSPEAAVSGIAEKLTEIVEKYGPSSVALYSGTYALAPPGGMVSGAFMDALGSPMSFSCGSIDQPGKLLARALHGKWHAGGTAFADAETWLFIGTNPAVSGLGGVPTINPNWHLHRAVKRGIKLIVIDPRRSETAQKARVHLQPVPGEDATILAGMIRLVLSEGLEDKAFVAENAKNLEELRQHVEPFTPEFVEKRADIPADQLREATRIFANAETGGASAGTGSNMSPRGTLAEYLLACLITLCGFRAKEGDRVPNPGVLVPKGPRRAQPLEPMPVAWGFPPALRVRGLSNTACGLPTGALADEILLEGDGQIRALFCLGGNPLTAWPDQIKTRAALEKLDLLVVLDPKMNQTARYADYVIPPKLVPEIPALSYDFEELETHSPGWGYPVPYASYREALVDPPEGSELLEDWELFYYLAREMKLPLQVYFGLLRDPGDPEGRFVPLDMENKPTTDDFFDWLTEGSRIPLSEVRQHEAGRLYEDPDAVVLARDPDCTSFLELGNPIMMEQLDEALQQGPLPGDEEFPFRLLSRRQKHTLNSLGRDQADLVRERPHNPLFMHPADMERIGADNGKIVSISSRRATIHAVVQESNELREGVVSMSHAYGIDLDRLKAGSDPSEPQEYSMGNHTGALASADLDYQEPYTGIPRMSSIPVHVTLGDLT